MNHFESVEQLLNSQEDSWQKYLKYRRAVYSRLMGTGMDGNMISEANWILRRNYECGEDMGIHAEAGDVVYLDYGQAYLNEMGYQHFGIIISVYRGKALIIPMTSIAWLFRNAYDPDENPEGMHHLMRLGKLEGMRKESVLYLNDLKYINTARIIRVIAHLDTDSDLYRRICRRMLEVMFAGDVIQSSRES
ncbi:MAG: type II toxin-antitoxin system PemK/MazF family toxin [Solobacterium sp.]|nr:type II toxin-antitoxin system PemK/MazF family toxin [Solobacterium sp.]